MSNAKNLFLWVLLLGMTLSYSSCTEQIDDSNFAIKNEESVSEFVSSHENFTMIKALWNRVNLGDSEKASSLFSVLSSRGNYTVFLPTDDAIRLYLSEVGADDLNALSKEQADLIAKSCIIDHGDHAALETARLPLEGSIGTPNISDRLLSCSLNEDNYFVINGTSTIISEDHEVSNGYIHIVDHVIAPSILTLDRQIGEAGNMKVFSYLLHQTTWADSLLENFDKAYENPERAPILRLGEFDYRRAEHRFIGYTAFIEPDSIYEEKLGLKVDLDHEGNLLNGEDFVKKVSEYVAHDYGTAHLDDLSHPDNPVNRFVAYHILDGKMPYNRMVYHYNEYNYRYGEWGHPQTLNMPSNVWEFYQSKGLHPSIVKVTQVGDAGFERDVEHKIYLNRISIYADGVEDDFRELGVVDGLPGILIDSENGEWDNNSINGYYFPINDMLVYSQHLRNELFRRRIRMDISSTMPELATNNLRSPDKDNTYFDKGYFSRFISQNALTRSGLSHAHGGPWAALWGDEFRVYGLYDFVYKLPPVPKDGTYEIRMGCSHGYIRGMVQIYFGDSPNNLQPAGLPYDMRQLPSEDNPEIPWFPDERDWVTNRERDKNLKNQGYLKGPQFFTSCTGTAEEPLRNRMSWRVIRRVITTADMRADRTYYLRFKSVLKKTDAELNIDFFEYASSAVFNGPQMEDIW